MPNDLSTRRDLSARVAGEVRAEMARQQITQQDLAAALGFSRHALVRRLNGDIPFDVRELEALSRYLNVPVERFLAGAA